MNQSLFTLDRPRELGNIEWIHALEEVHPLNSERSDPHVATRPHHPGTQTRGHRQAVWSPTGSTGHRELFDAQSISDRRDIVHAIHDRAPRIPTRTAIAGPVIGDHPRTRHRVFALIRMAVQPPARSAMKTEHREAPRVAPLGETQRSTITHDDGPTTPTRLFHASDTCTTRLRAQPVHPTRNTATSPCRTPQRRRRSGTSRAPFACAQFQSSASPPSQVVNCPDAVRRLRTTQNAM